MNIFNFQLDDNMVFVAVPLMGVLILALMIYTTLAKRKSCTERTYAKIVDIKIEKTKSSSEEHTRYIDVYTPVVEYYFEGKPYIAEFDETSNHCKYKIGDEVEIKYNADNPDNFYFIDNNLSIIVCSVLLVLCLGLSVLFALIPWK